MTETNNLIVDAADQIQTTVRDYNRRLIGGNLDSDSVTGRALKQKDIFKLEKLHNKLDIEDLGELHKLELNLEQMEKLVEIYMRDLRKAERVLRDNNQDGLADELETDQMERLQYLQKELK